MNERFTRLADAVSEGMGQWWVTACSVVVVLLWLLAGPFFRFSDTWQLMINTPTTIAELWIGFLIAAAANRTERRNHALHATNAQLLEHIERLLEREEAELETLARMADEAALPQAADSGPALTPPWAWGPLCGGQEVRKHKRSGAVEATKAEAGARVGTDLGRL